MFYKMLFSCRFHHTLVRVMDGPVPGAQRLRVITKDYSSCTAIYPPNSEACTVSSVTPVK